MLYVLLLTILGAALAMVFLCAELILAATFLRRPLDAVLLIVAGSWVVAMFPVTYSRHIRPADARAARRYFAVASVLPLLAGVLVYAVETTG